MNASDHFEYKNNPLLVKAFWKKCRLFALNDSENTIIIVPNNTTKEWLISQLLKKSKSESIAKVIVLNELLLDNHPFLLNYSIWNQPFIELYLKEFFSNEFTSQTKGFVNHFQQLNNHLHQYNIPINKLEASPKRLHAAAAKLSTQLRLNETHSKFKSLIYGYKNLKISQLRALQNKTIFMITDIDTTPLQNDAFNLISHHFKTIQLRYNENYSEKESTDAQSKIIKLIENSDAFHSMSHLIQQIQAIYRKSPSELSQIQIIIPTSESTLTIISHLLHYYNIPYQSHIKNKLGSLSAASPLLKLLKLIQQPTLKNLYAFLESPQNKYLTINNEKLTIHKSLLNHLTASYLISTSIFKVHLNDQKSGLPHTKTMNDQIKMLNFMKEQIELCLQSKI